MCSKWSRTCCRTCPPLLSPWCQSRRRSLPKRLWAWSLCVLRRSSVLGSPFGSTDVPPRICGVCPFASSSRRQGRIKVPKFLYYKGNASALERAAGSSSGRLRAFRSASRSGIHATLAISTQLDLYVHVHCPPHLSFAWLKPPKESMSCTDADALDRCLAWAWVRHRVWLRTVPGSSS